MHFILAIIAAGLLYILQAKLYEKYWDLNLSATVSYDRTHATAGEIVQLTEDIRNEKLLPLAVLYVKFSTSRTFLFEDSDNATVSDLYHRNDIFSIMGNQQITRTLSFRTTRRGYFTTDSIDLVVHDLFLHQSHAAKLSNHTSLYVYPALLSDQSSLSLTSSVIGNLSKNNQYEDPLSFRGIRDYTNHDSMRYINWKATAKQQQLMVNTYFDIQNTEVVLLFNLDTNIIQRDHRLQEYSISIVATLLHHLNIQGFATRLAINIEDPFSNEIITTELGIGEEHMQSLFQILARLDLEKELSPFDNFFRDNDSLFRNTKTNTAYLIVSNYRKDSLLHVYNEKRSKGVNIHFICPEEKALYSPIANVQHWEVIKNEV